MPKEEAKKGSDSQSDPDEDFFKSHPDLTDEDKSFLRTRAIADEYLEHRRKLREKMNEPERKKGLFSNRRERE